MTKCLVILKIFFQNIYAVFCKDYSAQHCLLVMIQKSKKLVDYAVVFGTLLSDLSQAFNCILHELFIVKLEAYGFQMDA